MSASDEAIGRLIRWLSAVRLSVHIPIRGEAYFEPSRRKRNPVIWPWLDASPPRSVLPEDR